MQNLKPPIIIQARMGSKRLPGKVLATLSSHTVLEFVIQRCRLSKNTSEIMVATTTLPHDDAVMELAASLGVLVCRGSEDDVLSRYVDAAQLLQASVLIRITADCPMIDPKLIDRVVDMYQHAPADYVFVQGYPIGLGAAELLTVSALRRSLAETSIEEKYYREHVMTYILDHPEKFALHIENAPPEYRKPEIHLSVDEPVDLDIVRRICEHFAPRLDFQTQEILGFLENHPDLMMLSRRRTN